jgi:2-haloacid dehalogenase
VVTLTKSVAAVVEDQLRNAGLRDLVDAVHSADEVGRLKPAPEPYLPAITGRPPAEAILIAAHDWDIAGAASAGLRTAFISRDGQPPLAAHAAPTLTTTSLDDTATELIERYA